jgi:hypothetical protein
MFQTIKVMSEVTDKLELTFVLGIVTGIAKNFQGTDEVKSVETLVQGKEDLDWLERDFTILWNDCTHFAGIVV